MRYPSAARGLTVGSADTDIESAAAQDIHRRIIRADPYETCDSATQPTEPSW